MNHHLQPHPCRDTADLARMAALVRAHPADHVHVIDLPYRLCSWALDSPTTSAIWDDGGALPVAWAVLQTPFWTLDYALRPDAPPDMLAAVLDWVNRQAPQLPESFAHSSWYVPVFARLHERRRALAAAGFITPEDATSTWSQVLYTRDAAAPVPHGQLDHGYAVRPLAGAAEVPAYVELHRAVFGTTNMTEAWRTATLRRPEYRPELDLVATGPDGRLAAFCVGWFAASGIDGRPAGQIEPLGVRHDARRHGLAAALVHELASRLRALGAATILVMTDDERDAANAFYQAVGFSPRERILMVGKDYPR